ncbi:MAG: GatB/YqeY domain-containing protein [Ornithinimicrobium sp.]
MDDQARGMKATLRNDLTESIRSRDAVRSSTLRMALTAVTNAEVAGKTQRDLSDDEVVAVVAQEAKRRKEASAAYTGAGRPELAAAEDAELEILQVYLPEQLDNAELDRLAIAAVAQVGATGMAQMGQVMKVVQPQVAGRAEGGRVAAAVKRALDPR